MKRILITIIIIFLGMWLLKESSLVLDKPNVDWVSVLQETLPIFIHPYTLLMLIFIGIIFCYWCFAYALLNNRLIKIPQIHHPTTIPTDMPLIKLQALVRPVYGKDDDLTKALVVDLAQKNVITYDVVQSKILLNKDQKENAYLSTGQRYFLEALEQYDEEDLTDINDGALNYSREFYYVPFGWVNQFLMIILLGCIAAFYGLTSGYFLALMLFPLAGGLLSYVGLTSLFSSNNDLSSVGGFFLMLFLIIIGFVFGAVPLIFSWNDVAMTTAHWSNAVTMWLACILLGFVCALFGMFGQRIKPEYLDAKLTVLSFKYFIQHVQEGDPALHPKIFEEYLVLTMVMRLDRRWMLMFKKLYPEEYEKFRETNVGRIYELSKSSEFVSNRRTHGIDKSKELEDFFLKKDPSDKGP